MTQLVNFFSIYENTIYFMLGLGAILYGWRFWRAWKQLSESVYGLEREIASSSLNRSAVFMFLLLMMGLIVFSAVTFAAPFLPIDELIATPTLELLRDSSSSQEPQSTLENGEAVIQTPTPFPTVSINDEACIENRLIITSPTSGTTIRGMLDVEGTVDVENFGFFQVEYARVQDGLWLPISVKRNIVINGLLVEGWDSSPVPAGDYILQLLVTDNTGIEFEPCRVQIRIEGEE